MAALELKGKAEPVEAHRLLGVGEQQPDRRHDTPLVGRERSCDLDEAFERASEERHATCSRCSARPGSASRG